MTAFTFAFLQQAAGKAGTIWEHIPPEIAAALIAVILSMAGGTIGLVVWFFKRDRASLGAQEKAQWDRIDEMRKAMDATIREVDLLNERIQHIPDFAMIQDRMDNMESKMDEKMDKLATRLERAVERMLGMTRCEYRGHDECHKDPRS